MTTAPEPEADTAAPRRIAAFDFDGTISRHDTLLGFLVAVGGKRATAAALAGKSVGLARGMRDDVERDAAKEAVVGRVLRGRTHDELVAAGRAYADRLVAAELRPETTERIGWHRAEGHELVIVSASLVYYLEPLAEQLGFTAVIGVEMATGTDGRLTGELARPNVRAEQKALRLREWLGAPAAGPLTGFEVWAYGNSSGDDHLLELADHPVWVGKRASRNPA